MRKSALVLLMLSLAAVAHSQEQRRFKVWLGIMGVTGDPTLPAGSLDKDFNRNVPIDDLMNGAPARELGGPFTTDGPTGHSVVKTNPAAVGAQQTLYQYRRGTASSNNGGTIGAGMEYRITDRLWAELAFQYGGGTTVQSTTTEEYLAQTNVTDLGQVGLTSQHRWLIEAGRFAQVQNDKIVMRSHHLSLNLKYDLFSDKSGFGLAPVIGLEMVTLDSIVITQVRTNQYDVFVPETVVGGSAEGLPGLRHEIGFANPSFEKFESVYRPTVGLDIAVGSKSPDREIIDERTSPCGKYGCGFILRIRYAVSGTNVMTSPTVDTPMGSFNAPYPVRRLNFVFGFYMNF